MRVIPLASPGHNDREKIRSGSDLREIWDILDEVKDPELPAVSIWDMGILRDVVRDGNRFTISITPTYSGCPAMDQICHDIKDCLRRNGIEDCEVRMQISPAWNTDCISPLGKQQLRESGIAPPVCIKNNKGDPITPGSHIECPLCNSGNTTCISEFGSTACKALFRCNDCHEPFDYFKCI